MVFLDFPLIAYILGTWFTDRLHIVSNINNLTQVLVYALVERSSVKFELLGFPEMHSTNEPGALVTSNASFQHYCSASC